jgi:membrane protein
VSGCFCPLAVITPTGSKFPAGDAIIREPGCIRETQATRTAQAMPSVNFYQHLRMRLHRLLWADDLAAARPFHRRAVFMLRLSYAVARDLAEGQLTLRAMSLVYTTLLSLVPLLALCFSVLKAFGVHNQVRPMLLTWLAPLGDKGQQMTEHVIGFIENIRVGVLGAVGLGLLIYTVTALLQKIESAFNFVWHVRRARPIAQRFSQYLSVLTVGPVLVFSALGITATLANARVIQMLMTIEPFGTLIAFTGRLLPYLFVMAAFAFVYVFMPNTRVRLRSALVGAVIAGFLWQTLGWGFATFVAASTKYTAIYAGFAIVIMAMIWLYLNWLIVLVGASFAFYHQNPAQLGVRRHALQLSNRLKEKLALLIAAIIGRDFYYSANAPAWTTEALASRLGVPLEAVQPVVQAMVGRGLVTETADEPPCHVPARAFETVSVKELLDAVRAAEEDLTLTIERLPNEPPVDAMLARLDTAMGDSLRGQTLRELASPPPDVR